MTDYYVDPVATGGNTGADWTNAWTSLQSAADTATAGDTVYCRGTQTLTAAIDYDTNSGSDASGFIKFIGCNSSGNVDGTQFVLDGNNAATNCILLTTRYHIWYENVEMKNATGDGWDAGTGYFGNMVFINCSSHNNGGDGWNHHYGNTDRAYVFIKCSAYSNSGDGFGRFYYGRAVFIMSTAHSNVGGGFDASSSNDFDSTYYGCISYDNGGVGYKSRNGTWLNCIADENDDDGINIPFGIGVVIGSRLTDNGKDTTGYGLNGVTQSVYGWNFLLDNDSGATTGKINAIRDGTDADTNETSGTEGYTDGAGRDYNLTSSATLRRTKIEL